MKLLLDTHVVLAWLHGDDIIDPRVERHLADTSNQLMVSAVVVWEVAIKRVLGKLEVPMTFVADVVASEAVKLPISIEHAAAVERLPHHHRDPFDRLLIAQATIEDATLVSADKALQAYDVAILW